MPISSPPSVLISDAEPHHTRVFEAKLSRQNAYSVTSAASAGEALSFAFQRTFDIILWDMRLRETFVVLPRLRSLCPNATLLLMTTDDRPVVPDEIARLNVADILVKPIGLDTLIQRIEAARARPVSGAGLARVELGFVGQAIRLSQNRQSFSTRIWEVNPNTFSVIAPPRVAAPAGFEPEARILAEVLSEDALYRFVTRIGEHLSTPIPLWQVQMPALIRRHQRRSAVRASINLPVRLLTEASLPVEAVTHDISTSGCLVLAKEPLEVGARIQIEAGEGMRGIEGEGEVVRLEPLPPTEAENSVLTRYEIAVQFTELAPETQQFLKTLSS